MTPITLTAAFVSVILTIVVVWANPRRFSNQIFSLVTFVQTIWLSCVYRVTTALSTPDGFLELERWLRVNAVVISFLPATIWLLTSAISSCSSKLRIIGASLPIFGLSVYAAFLCYGDDFLFPNPHNKATEPLIFVRGLSYYIYVFIGLIIYLLCVVKVWIKIKQHDGIQKVELQFLALNAGGTALFLGALNAAGNFFQLRILNRASIILIIAASAVTAWALLFHRVFNAREILINFLQRSTVILSLSAGIYGIWYVTHSILPEPFGLLLSIGLCSTLAVWLDRKSHDWFERRGKKKLAQMRQTAIEMADAEMQTENLVSGYEKLLQVECSTPVAELLFPNGSKFVGTNLTMDADRSGFNALVGFGWATPENLLRRRSSPKLRDLQSVLAESSLGLMIPVPRGSTTPSFIIALGTKSDAWPFTYPEIERLRDLGDLLDSLLTRSRLTAQAALQARIEYLAMASRGLAHDLKNLITPVSSFLVHTDHHFSPGSTEGQIHAAARRANRIMSEYVRETLCFAQELKPRFELIGVERILHVVDEVVESRAAKQGVKIVATSNTNEPVTADGVLLGRMLANLVANAIDASSAGQSVQLNATKVQNGWTRFEVIDQGSGISEENLARVFDPYFTTKGFGDDVRGFGLGLTIAQKIVLLHRGKISVLSQIGRGTRFTVDLPINQTPKPAPVSLPVGAPVQILA